MSEKRIRADILIIFIARSDAAQEHGVDEAIKRCRAAATADTDIAFVEASRDEEEARKVVAELAPTPCPVNIVRHGVTPNWIKEEIKELCFKLAIYPRVRSQQ